MKIYLDDSTVAWRNAKESPYSVIQITVLRGYIQPSD
jgi:hypothetical protein